MGGIHFKPYSDGSGHWVCTWKPRAKCYLFHIHHGWRVTVSVAALLVAVFLKGFEKEIQTEIFSTSDVARSEISIEVANIESVPSDMRILHIPTLKAIRHAQ